MTLIISGDLMIRKLVPILLLIFSNVFASQAMLNDDSWKEVTNKNGVIIYSQKSKLSKALAFKAVGDLEAPIEQILELLRRVDLATSWMPRLASKKVITNISDFEAVTYSVNDLPWPFTDRDMILSNSLIIDRESKKLVVEIKSVKDKNYPIIAKNVRSIVHLGQTWMEPLGERRTKVTVIVLIDPMGHIPMWLVNLLQKNLPYNLLKNLEREAARSDFPLRPSFKKVLKELYNRN